jgi:hypothetical protein
MCQRGWIERKREPRPLERRRRSGHNVLSNASPPTIALGAALLE